MAGLFSNHPCVNVLGLPTLQQRKGPSLLELMRSRIVLPGGSLVVVCLQHLGRLAPYEDVDAEIMRTLRAEEERKVCAEDSQD